MNTAAPLTGEAAPSERSVRIPFQRPRRGVDSHGVSLNHCASNRPPRTDRERAVLLLREAPSAALVSTIERQLTEILERPKIHLAERHHRAVQERLPVQPR